MPTEREAWIARARRLALIALFYNLAEAAASAFFGMRDGSLSLRGFGGDSLIEAASAAVVLWRFASVVDGVGDAKEKAAQKWIGLLLMALALYLAISSWFEFRRGQGPSSGLAGLWIALVSLGVMAWLYRAKMACALALQSRALKADAFCSLSCMWLSGLLLAGSALLALTHIAWFDPLTGLGMAVLIAREGMEEYEEATE